MSARRPLIIVAELCAVRTRMGCASTALNEALWESLNDASERLTDELDAAIRERLGIYILDSRNGAGSYLLIKGGSAEI